MKRKIKKTVSFIIVLLFVVTQFFCAGKSVVQLYNLGVEQQQEENWYVASQYFLEVVTKNPAYTDAWYKLSECSYKLGEFDLALSYLEQAESYEKNNSAIQNLKGMILLSLNRIDEAKTIFNKILKDYPNDIDAHFGLAEIELYEGRFSGAEVQYSEALKRQNTNRKALLSLAVVCAETNRYQQAETFLKQAMTYYSGEPEVHYLAAVVYAMKGDYVNAEKQARIAVEVNGNYNSAYELMANVIYMQNRFDDVINICDYLISRDRKNEIAWYLKGIALEKQGKKEEAIAIWSAGLNIKPQDELMRAMMELNIRENLSLDDNRRKNWADYHLLNARQFKSAFDNSGAVYEYQRALLLDPMNKEAREAYASILEMNGLYELYLTQLKFIKDHNYKDTKSNKTVEINDKIEAYDSLLEKTIGKKWNIDPFYLDKTRWNIAIFYTENESGFSHADSDRLAALSASDIFSGVAITSVKTQVTPVEGFGDAFRTARANNYDYFIIMSLSEGKDDLTLKSTIYSARTGLEVSKNSFYGTGNNRFSTVMRRFKNSVLGILPVRGKILKREGKTVLVDLGKSENVITGTEFVIIKKGNIKTADKGTGIYYRDEDVLGNLIITDGGEEVSEGEIKNNGFYDRINIDDEVVLLKLPEDKTAEDNVIDNVPTADKNGNNVVNQNEPKNGEELVKEIKKAVEKPSIINILKNIY